MREILRQLKRLHDSASELPTLSASVVTGLPITNLEIAGNNMEQDINDIIRLITEFKRKAFQRETLTLSIAHSLLEEIDLGLPMTHDEYWLSILLRKHQKEIRWCYHHLIPQIERSDDNYKLIHSAWVFAGVYLTRLSRLKRGTRHLELFESFKGKLINSVELGFLAGALLGYRRKPADDYHFITSEEFGVLIDGMQTMKRHLQIILLTVRRLSANYTNSNTDIETSNYVRHQIDVLLQIQRVTMAKVETFITDGPKALESILKEPFRHVDRRVGVRRRKHIQGKSQVAPNKRAKKKLLD